MKATQILIPLALLALLGAAGWQLYQRQHDALPPGLIQANGRLEGDTVRIATKYAGRLATLPVSEGQALQAGEVVATLVSDELAARASAADAAIAAAQAQLQRARAASAQADKDAQRFERLLDSGAVERIRTEQMQLAAVSARSQAEQAQQQLGQARAARQELAAVLRELTVRAPQAGTVTLKLHEAGEVVAAGSPLLELVDLQRLYLKVYVPETQIGQVRLGLPARIYSDAFPGRSFDARVSYIAHRAEFTPKEVQTSDERAKLVYAVKLQLAANPAGQLSPGVPADAVIRWQEGTPWQAPRW